MGQGVAIIGEVRPPVESGDSQAVIGDELPHFCLVLRSPVLDEAGRELAAHPRTCVCMDFTVFPLPVAVAC